MPHTGLIRVSARQPTSHISSLPFPAFLTASRSGVVRILVQADVEDGAVFVENVLCAVTVMNVPVYDRDTLEPVDGLKIPGGNRRVIEQAEPHDIITPRVMAGRADGAKGVPDRTLGDGLSGRDNASCCEPCGGKRIP